MHMTMVFVINKTSAMAMMEEDRKMMEGKGTKTVKGVEEVVKNVKGKGEVKGMAKSLSIPAAVEKEDAKEGEKGSGTERESESKDAKQINMKKRSTMMTKRLSAGPTSP